MRVLLLWSILHTFIVITQMPGSVFAEVDKSDKREVYVHGCRTFDKVGVEYKMGNWTKECCEELKLECGVNTDFESNVCLTEEHDDMKKAKKIEEHLQLLRRCCDKKGAKGEKNTFISSTYKWKANIQKKC